MTDFNKEPLKADKSTVEWRGRVTWLPRHEWMAARFNGWRNRRAIVDAMSISDGMPISSTGIGIVDAILLVFAVLFLLVIVAAIVWVVAIPLLLALVDIAILLLLFVLGVVGKMLFRRPWTVVATSSTGERREWKVRGLRRSRRVARTVEDALNSGINPDPLVASSLIQ